MKTILVDDNIIELQGFEIECANVPDIQIVGKFTSALGALEYAKYNTVDFAVLDIEMPDMNGLELFDKLREIRSNMLVIFVTSHTSAAVEAIRKKIDYIVFKPYDKKDIEDVLSRAKLMKRRLKNRVYCHTFGEFDVFIDDVPIMFKSAKAKEIFAFCVYRKGAPVSAEEIIDKLWVDYTGIVGDCSVFRMAVKSLVDQLKSCGCEEIFVRDRGWCHTVETAINCDYYDFLNEDPKAICQYQGEFMSNYEWGNMEKYHLNERKLLVNPGSLIEE
ncbi:MAG: response regulator [Anaerovoracaceae bacterium]